MTNVTLQKLKEELDNQRRQLIDEFEKRNESIKIDLLASFDKIHAELSASLQSVTDEAQSAKKMAADNAGEIVRLKSTIDSLVDANKVQSTEIKKMRERIEERTNRQLRNTLVVKGIPEPAHERTWNDTKQVLAESIAESLQISVPTTIFERAHRSNFAGRNGEKRGRRDIFVRVHDWNVSEKMKEDFRALRMKNRNCQVSVDQKFGPRTTSRRNYALFQRKTLKENGDIFAGYIAYPAKLMVKKTNNKTEKYAEYENYSEWELDSDLNIIPPG